MKEQVEGGAWQAALCAGNCKPSRGIRAVGMGRVVKMRELVGKQNLEGPRRHLGSPLNETGNR